MRILYNKFTKTIKHAFEHKRSYTTFQLKPPWKILFFGTDEFSLSSLKTLIKEYEKQEFITKLEVVTSCAKQNIVRKFATESKLTIHNWPIINNINDFHLGIVVSFGHLIPKDVINIFPMGMLNVHASLLPRWRGAAPIIYALANGDDNTGVTIMKIRPHRFDCGEILMQKTIAISKDMKMPELYSSLANLGAKTLLEVVSRLPNILDDCISQSNEGVMYAPRVNAKLAVVDWKNSNAQQVYNLSRALTGVFNLTTHWNDEVVKLYNINNHETLNFKESSNEINPGCILYDKTKKLVLVQCSDGKWISCDKVGINKKIINATDFNNGYIKKENVNKRIFR